MRKNKTKFKKKNEQGFAIALSILMLVIMSMMGVSLVLVASNDHAQNSKKDYTQQTFYAAETGIAEAKKYLETISKTSIPTSVTKWNNPNNNNWCTPSLFRSLDSNNVYRLNNRSVESTLDNVIASTKGSEEHTRLQKYRYYYFITHSPKSDGSTNVASSKTISSSSGTGSSAAVGTSYKNQGSANAYYYGIFACGKGEEDTIVALDSIVAIIK